MPGTPYLTNAGEKKRVDIAWKQVYASFEPSTATRSRGGCIPMLLTCQVLKAW